MHSVDLLSLFLDVDAQLIAVLLLNLLDRKAAVTFERAEALTALQIPHPHRLKLS
jgi:hypothetical protein